MLIDPPPRAIALQRLAAPCSNAPQLVFACASHRRWTAGIVEHLMKKLSAFLNTPARVVIAVGLIILVSELLIMVLIETIHATVLQDPFVEKLAFEFLDPIALIAIVSPALYLLIFRPLNQQTELERQLDELRSFQRLSIGRELRIKELVKEIAALRSPLFVEPVGAIPVTGGSLEKLRHEAGQHATTQT